MRHRSHKAIALAIGLALSAPLWPICAGAAPANGAALTGVTPQQALAAMRRDAQTIASMTRAWTQVEQSAQSYGQMAAFAAREWAGEGPVVRMPLGGEALCHNSRWDSLTNRLVTGGLNIAGDAEALAYAMQVVTVDFQQQYDNYLTDAVADQSPAAQYLTQNLNALKASTANLGNLLTRTGNQISQALGPNSPLHPLPLQNWQAGIGDAPNLAAARYLPGPKDGVPIGWIVPPESAMAELEDVCPTGTASLPMLPLRGPVLSAAELAVTESPDMASQLQPLEGGSTWNLPSYGTGYFGRIPSLYGYTQRVALVSGIAADMPALSGLMQPISGPLAAYDQNVQQLLSEVQSHA
jgi:hypothetical protein